MDIIKKMTKENIKEESHLFQIQRKIFEKVNFSLKINNLKTKIETYSIEKKFFKKKTSLEEDPKNISPFFKTK